MPKFVHKNIEAINGKQQFRQLVVVDDREDARKIQKEIDELEAVDEQVPYVGVLDEYENKLESKYRSSFRSLLAIMDRVANLQGLPVEKFRDITPDKQTVKEYEFKCQDLRVYAIKIANGKMILLGGYKNNQSEDISGFRSLKKEYLHSLEEDKKVKGKK